MSGYLRILEPSAWPQLTSADRSMGAYEYYYGVAMSGCQVLQAVLLVHARACSYV